jgi:glycosyltransferase involved in cell wall biosynthesis
MKILFASFRHDPTLPGSETGADYQFLKALQKNEIETKVVGPFLKHPILIERIIKKFYKLISGSQYLKYDLSNTIRASLAVGKYAREWRPDLIFTLYPPPLAFYSGNIPCVFRSDATFLGSYAQAPKFHQYGKLILKTNAWIEKKAFNKCALIITHSQWTAQSLVNDYKLSADKIVVFPNPSSLSENWIPSKIDVRTEKEFKGQVRLLFVGRDEYRKGLDIALETISQLNNHGLPSVLTVCGLDGHDQEHVKYTGNLNKSDDNQLIQYISLLRNSHLLLHPARFDPSPRIISEAAAFGIPAITNSAGGLATSVKNNISGIVLPQNSSPKQYVEAIIELFQNPERYYELCRTSRERYEHELNWTVAGSYLAKILKKVVDEKPSHRK